MSSKFSFITKLWSIYDFQDPEKQGFAQEKLMLETRQGLKLMSTLLIFLVLIAMLFFKQISLIDSYSLNYFWVIALSAHINISTRVISDIKTLHALGVTLLVISAMAYVFIAHQTGEFSPLLLANIVLLFMVIPMVPWGLREASFIVISIYLLLTLSALNGPTRFDQESIKVLQFFLVAASTTSLLLVIRSTMIRKKELISHFDLQKAHAELYTLSNTDPLTGAWNRRYTELAISNLVSSFSGKYEYLNYIIFDLDKFKILNDTFGHDFGDRVLIVVSKLIMKAINKQGHLIRIGGDEFILLLVGFDAETFMNKIQKETKALLKEEQTQAIFDLSWGIVTLALAPVSDIEAVYQQADQRLYAHKIANQKKQLEG